MSAANEVVVEAFLAGAIPWRSIAELDAEALDRWDGGAADSLDAVLDADRRAREVAQSLVGALV